MAKISFQLTHVKGYSVKKSDSLKEIWKHIRIFINEPTRWVVEQVDSRDNVQCKISAYYLTENFKEESTFPETISDIKQP